MPILLIHAVGSSHNSTMYSHVVNVHFRPIPYVCSAQNMHDSEVVSMHAGTDIVSGEDTRDLT